MCPQKRGINGAEMPDQGAFIQTPMDPMQQRKPLKPVNNLEAQIDKYVS